jgi:hypothetical protein
MDDERVETGLVTATVMPPPIVAPPAIITKAPASLTASELAKLAGEIARNYRPLAEVVGAFGMTEDQYREHVLPNVFFKKALDASTIEWNSALSIPQRIKLGAAAILEDSLVILGKRMRSEKEALPAVVQAATMFTKLAGIGEDTRSALPGEKFTITINLGADKQQFTETVGSGKTIEGAVEIQPFSERETTEIPIRPFPEGPAKNIPVQPLLSAGASK